MKRVFALLFCVCMVLSLTACTPEEHTHQPASTTKTGENSTMVVDFPTVTVHCEHGNTYSFADDMSADLTNLLAGLVYDPDKVCRCLPEITVDTELGTGYGIHLSQYYVRTDEGQADLTEKQCELIDAALNINTDGGRVCGCDSSHNTTFLALVKDHDGKTMTVEPLKGEEEQNSSSIITFSTKGSDAVYQAGMVIEVTYKGGIMETYPAQINAVSWKTVTELRDREYPAEWLDKKTATAYTEPLTTHFTITAIYKDCFFVQYVLPMNYVGVKINGTLSDEWCVGDQVEITAENLYDDTDRHRLEGDMCSIKASTFTPDPGVAYKPVIYLYPEKDTAVSVKLNLNGELTCTYPAYGDGWNVTASPDGTLTDTRGQTYNYLYWEGDITADWEQTRGFCVSGNDTAAFLETALSQLGLTRREANEFIVYWLPQMQENPYNVITFQTTAYTDAAALDITPTPDTLIRVFMTYKAVKSPVSIAPQTLTAPPRVGFTAVEWGGTEL